MGRIVAAVGVPHTPVFPRLAAEPAGADLRARYSAVADLLAAARPDVLCVFHCDHINAFFLDNWPTFAVVAAETVRCPVDEVPQVPQTDVAVHTGLSVRLYEHAVRREFDPSLVMRAGADHGLAVPLHFLDPRHRLPVVPLHINGMVAPFPSARRCLALGRVVAEAVADWAADVRVAVVASGSFSLEVGGPRVPPGAGYAVPRADWAARVVQLLRAGDLESLVREATPPLLADAGTVAGELLSWIATAGAVDGLTLARLDHREGEAHAFAAWTR
ncbi:hypothetical protein POF50_028940 [Streptomyces sp. SL13]|uniref:Extradiol ring-cleavage dioxygenase class III enzyme subunit B domain-containing protein n=1 Tax=Streptantibioticus silvisoli TaxID=2705255 RepID=A0AA90HAP3_9ACTN|nr:hypothetical protein [Streptantibioticus silvisoli]MDI5973324.1 hypothetical protein [Streptantibioticus silvisoli]